MNKICIVDYGLGNLKSIQRGLEQVGAKVILSSRPKEISIASHLVLPGVGAFEAGMSGLKDAGLIAPILDFVETGNPLLGICLGMQMLLDKSEEQGKHRGLGLIPGIVRKIPQSLGGTIQRKIPNIGWIELQCTEDQDWEGSCLKGVCSGEYFYFVHSFMAVPDETKYILAQCNDEGFLLTAAVKRENITGLQFHPEKSGEQGLKVLKSFVNK